MSGKVICLSPLPGECVFPRMGQRVGGTDQRGESLIVESQAFREVIFLGWVPC